MMLKVEIYCDRRGEWRWRARAKNHKIVADGSESYSTKSSVRRAVRRIATGVLFGSIVEVKPDYGRGMSDAS
jgi:uncharacterized protein YegP (UPF0339 family)